MFRTIVGIEPYPRKINYESNILTLGSCFSENIGRKMQDVFFLTEVNPFGVLYNPVSIQNSIELLLEKESFTKSDIFEHHSLWQSFSHSGLFSDVTPEKCLTRINNRFTKAAHFLKNTDFLLITFGTAWVFEEKKSGRVVSNCHKLPANYFIRRRLTVGEIAAGYFALITKLNELLPQLNIILSVSPIRHLKDGAHENTVSKSALLMAIDEIQKQFGNVVYFPAYEILMDELRDYRFYAADMLHPSEVAVDYIWQKFSETFFSEETIHIKKQLEQLTADKAHHPLHPDSDEFKLFLKNINVREMNLLKQYPFLSGRLG